MNYTQADLFAEGKPDTNNLPEAVLASIRERLQATLSRLEETRIFPWSDPLQAVHEENRFQRGSEMLGEEGLLLWERFDKEMDRLYATQEDS
jgi:hypothetical protein